MYYKQKSKTRLHPQELMGKSIRKKKKALKPLKIPYEFIEKESSQTKKKRGFITQQMDIGESGWKSEEDQFRYTLYAVV